MKNETKRKNAAVLLDEIGNIDDIYLAEAAERFAKSSENAEKRTHGAQIPVRPKRAVWRVVLPVAAAFLALVVGTAVLFPARARKGAAPKEDFYDKASNIAAAQNGRDGNAAGLPNGSENLPESAETSQEISAVYDRIFTAATPERTIPADVAPTGNGNAYLAWRTDGNSEISVGRALTAQEADDLFARLSRLPARGADDAQPTAQAWVIRADGTVVALLAPNLETATFAAYVPAVAPNDDLISLLTEISGD